MSKTLRTVGMIAGAIALVATGVGAFAGGALAASATSIATYATVAAGVANLGAAATANNKPPPVRGTVTQILISPDAPMPYVMGEGYYAGILRHDTAYGATLKKVPNPNRWMVMVYSGAGPVQAITPYVDQGSDLSYYSTFMDTVTRLGATPDTVMTPPYGTAPGWDANSKLSGNAAIGWNLKFDKDGQRYASGLPQIGAYGQWVKVYDPRLDDTYPGGSGAHRLGNETTYTWSENPALHAATYAYGRYQSSKRVFGAGLPSAAIDWASVVAWANTCDTNVWKIFGVIYEPMPETRWPNLKDICAAGGAVPIFSSGVLSFHYAAPRVALDTFTEVDLAEGTGSVTAMTSRRTRLNTIVPKYRSSAHNWEMVAATNTVSDAAYVTEDGEERRAEWPFNLVKHGNQAAQLAGYVLADGRELQPITLTFGHRVREYRPGECVHLEIPSLALDHDAIILTREFNPATMATTFTFISETAAKHAWALGRTATAPPTATLTPQTPAERDDVAAGVGLNPNDALIRTALVKNPRDVSDVARELLIATDVGANVTISVARHDWDYPDGEPDVTRALGTITGLSFATTYYVYFDDATLANTAPTYVATTDLNTGINSTANPGRHPLGVIVTPADGAAATEGGPVPGYGYIPEASVPSFVLDAATDFTASNNRNATTPAAPTVLTTGTAIDHTGRAGFNSSNTDGSVNISFEWDINAAAGTYDGHEVSHFRTVSSAPYVIGGASAAAEDRKFVLPGFSGTWVNGAPSDLWHTFGVRCYRVVDNDIYDTWAAGNPGLAATTTKPVIVSAWVQPTLAAEDPYRPSANVPYMGDISGTVGYAPVAYTGDLVVRVKFSWAGTLVAGQLFKYQIKRMKGNTDVSSSATWSVTTVGHAATISNGLLTITGFGSYDGYVLVTSTYEGIAVEHLIPIELEFSGPPLALATTRSIGEVFGGAGLNSTSYTTYSGILAVTTGATGSIALNCYYGAAAEAAGSTQLRFKLQRRTGGGAWSDVANTAHVAVAFDARYPLAVAGGLKYVVTGLPTSTVYEFQVQVRREAVSTATGRFYGKLFAARGY